MKGKTGSTHLQRLGRPGYPLNLLNDVLARDQKVRALHDDLERRLALLSIDRLGGVLPFSTPVRRLALWARERVLLATGSSA